jgi:hypothetical protein
MAHLPNDITQLLKAGRPTSGARENRAFQRECDTLQHVHWHTNRTCGWWVPNIRLHATRQRRARGFGADISIVDWDETMAASAGRVVDLIALNGASGRLSV